MAKLKKKIKKTAKKSIAVKKRKTLLRKTVKKKAVKGIRKEILATPQIAVEQAKFSHPQILPVVQAAPRQDLPEQYGKDKIVLQVRDPWWLHAYWEVTAATLDRLKGELRGLFFSAKRALRVYDVSFIVFDGTNAHRFFDIETGPDANNWYIDTASPGRSWCVDFGLRLPDGKFITIVRSNVVHTPLDGPSWITDEEWMIPEDMFARLYGMGFGLGQSSPVGKAWQERVRKALWSSPGIASMASPVKK